MTSTATIDQQATPYLLIDEQRTRANIDRLAKYSQQHNIGLRPHIKTHKSLAIAQLQMDAGAIGLTVAKVGEAETISAVCDDILVAYPIVDIQRAQRLASLADKITITVAIDSQLSAEVLNAAAQATGSQIGILVDQDAGYGRTGLQTVAQTVELGQFISDQCSHLSLRGLFVYPGHIRGTVQNQQEGLLGMSEQIRATQSAWTNVGLPMDVVSGGSTPTAYTSHLIQELTEFRPGTYVYNDMNTVSGGYCGLEQCAATIVCTVVSNAVPNQVVLDGGTKTLTSDRCGPAPESGHGHILEFPQAKITHLTEEHAQVDVSACPAPPRLGDRVHIVPNHICVCVNLQDQIWQRESAESSQLKAIQIDGRGLLS